MRRLNVVASHIVPVQWHDRGDDGGQFGPPRVELNDFVAATSDNRVEMSSAWSTLRAEGTNIRRVETQPTAGMPHDLPQNGRRGKQAMTQDIAPQVVEGGEADIGRAIGKHVAKTSLFDRRVGVAFEFEDKVAATARRRALVRWSGRIQRVLLIKKWRDAHVRSVAFDIATWFVSQDVHVFVESSELEDYSKNVHFSSGAPLVQALDTSGRSKTVIDFVVSLGGDGTLLHASRLFRFLQCAASDLLPPCLVLGMGSLGFLATVESSHWQTALESVLRGHIDPVPCTLRTRLHCSLDDAHGERIAAWDALNECVVLCRGEAIGKLRLAIDGNFVTLVEGDGLIVSSPTGSTGYSLSCGGPIVCPSVPGTLLMPVAPASLSFRPVLVSEMSTIELVLPVGARCSDASVVIDGRKMGSLERGGRVLITVARPVPLLNVGRLDNDWFEAISSKLKWNVRDVEQGDVDHTA